jgi:glycine/D-amino acid oxidase-like deaminating enzyme
MIRSADVVVVGSGAFGSAIAYALGRKAGSRRIVLIERGAMASQTSPNAAGLTAQLRGTNLMSRLAIRAAELFVEFEHETGHPLDIVRSGSFRLARNLLDADWLQAESARGQQLGLDTKVISAEEAHRRHPFLQPNGIVAALEIPSDLYLEASQVAIGYAMAAAALGVKLVPHTAVTGFAVRDGSIQGCETDKGIIDCPVVIDAAGAWARALARLSGFDIPMVPTRHQLLITEPIDGVRDELPILRFIDASVYVRPCWGGFMMGGYEATPFQYQTEQIGSDFDVRDVRLDPDVLRVLAQAVADQLPVLQGAPIRLVRGGLPTMTIDGQHIIGDVPGVKGLFVASGCNVGGLSIAPAIGEQLAMWILTGASSEDLSPFALNRFGEGWRDESVVREAARDHYSNGYRKSVPASTADVEHEGSRDWV